MKISHQPSPHKKKSDTHTIPPMGQVRRLDKLHRGSNQGDDKAHNAINQSKLRDLTIIESLRLENTSLKKQVDSLSREVRYLRTHNSDESSSDDDSDDESSSDDDSDDEGSSEDDTGEKNAAVGTHKRTFGPQVLLPPTNHRTISSNQVILQEINILTDGDILAAGLSYCGYDTRRQEKVKLYRNIKRFNAFFGVSPTTLLPLMKDLKDMYPNMIYKDFLMSINWLFLYETREVLGGRWNRCENDIGRLVIQYAKMIQQLKGKKIKFTFTRNEVYLATYDTVNFTTQEFRLDPSAKYFDYKSHSAGLKYQFMLALEEPRIVHVSGPFHPSTPDIQAFRGGDTKVGKQNWDKESLYFQIPKGKMIIADSGLNGEPTLITTQSPEHPKEMRTWIGNALARQETLHSRLKYFNILGHRFRHGRSTQQKKDLHQTAVEAVCVIIQYDYENGHPPFDV